MFRIIDSDFTFETLRLKYSGKKVTGNPHREMDNLIGERTTLEHFCKIWWDQQRKFPDSLVGWNGESHEALPKSVLRLADTARLRMLWHK